MEPDLAEIRDNWEIIAKVAGAKGPQEALSILSVLKREERRIFDKLGSKSDAEMTQFVSGLQLTEPDDTEVVKAARTNVESVMAYVNSQQPFSFSSRFVDIRGYPFLYLEGGRIFIRLVFRTADGKFVVSDQDLEDSLGIAAEVLQSIADAVTWIMKNLRSSIDGLVLGDNMNKRLQNVERYTHKIGQLCSGEGGIERDVSEDGE